jgi:hypothetical protein
LWESLCSKALVFVDYMYVPHSHPLIDGEDVIFYDPLDKQGFMDKVKYYLAHHEEARRIAMNGFYKAMRHHRYINRVDYILTTVSLLTDPSYKVRPGPPETYELYDKRFYSLYVHHQQTCPLHHIISIELGHAPQGRDDSLDETLLHAWPCKGERPYDHHRVS